MSGLRVYINRDKLYYLQDDDYDLVKASSYFIVGVLCFAVRCLKLASALFSI